MVPAVSHLRGQEKKEETNDVQLELLVRYKDELPGWECGQVPGRVSRESVGSHLPASGTRGPGGLSEGQLEAGGWTGLALEHSHAKVGAFWPCGLTPSCRCPLGSHRGAVR